MVTLPLRLLVVGAALMSASACDRMKMLDIDLRGGAGQLDTSDAVRNATQSAPQPDDRGVVSYPEYQIAVARQGDTVTTIANRIGIPATDLARYNALPEDVALRGGEVLALPTRVGEPGTGAVTGTGEVDVATIAGTAIDRVETAPGLPAGEQPTRHQVRAGETAFSIARLYSVPVASLAEWNGLGSDLSLRVGQYLLIPTTTPEVEVATLESGTAPGQGSVTPLPPSAAAPLPEEDATPTPAPAPQRTAMATQTTVASDTSRLRMPVRGQIVRPYAKGSNDGIGISAVAGSSVVAADKGTVAAITLDTDQVPILVLRHENNLLTVYAGVDDISVEKGDSVERGQKIAVVRDSDPAFLHFEVREGFDSVDPGPYLN